MEQWFPVIYPYLFIFFARVTDMSLDVLRILMLMKDRRLWASVIGFFEVAIFVLALNAVLKGGLTDPGKVVAYAGGFATGNYLGSFIESKLALGFLSINIIPPKHLVEKFTCLARQDGFGVTSVKGCGRDGERTMLFVMIKRKDLNKALALINNICPHAFFNVSDARRIHGGVFPVRKGK